MRAWFPFYPDAYLGATASLSTEEHGAYLLLILEYWRTGSPLPDDDGTFSSLAKMSRKKWKNIRAKLARFFVVENGVWRHDRIERELEKARKYSDSQKERSKLGVAARRASAVVTGNPVVNHGVTPVVNPEVNPLLHTTVKEKGIPNGIPKKKTKSGDEIFGFADFWKIFPAKLVGGRMRRQNRAKAAKAFAKAVGDGVSVKTLIAGAEAYAAERRDENPEFNLHAATWLNGKRWMDEDDGQHSGKTRHNTPSAGLANAGRAVLARLRTTGEEGAGSAIGQGGCRSIEHNPGPLGGGNSGSPQVGDGEAGSVAGDIRTIGSGKIGVAR